MAFGSNKTNPNQKLFTFKIRSKDKDKKEVPVYLEVKEKVGDAYEVRENAKFVSGTVTGVEHDERIWEGKLLQNAKITMRSGDSIYFLTVPYNILGRSILNALVNLKTFNDVEISVYMSKPKTEGKKSYPAAIVRQAEQRVEWKHALDSLPKAVEHKTSKGIIRDFGAIDQFFIDEVKAFSKQFGATRPAVAAATSSIPSVADEDSVPF